MDEAIAKGVSDDYLCEEMHRLRQQIDACIKKARLREGQMLGRPGTHELGLVTDKLKEAKMWCGKVLEELNSPLPEEYRDEAKESENQDNG